MFNKILTYIEIDNNTLFLSILKKQRTNFYLKSKENFNLNNFEFKETKIFSPSKIYLFIKKFMQKNKFRKADVITNIPTLINYTKEKQKLIVLQHILVLTKAGLKITKIISKNYLEKKEDMFFLNKKELNKELDFFKPFKTNPNNSPTLWLFFSFLALIISTIICNTFYKNTKNKLIHIDKKNFNISQENISLEKQIIQLNSLSTKNLMIKKILTKLKNSDNTKELLILLAKNIPKNTWVTIFKTKNTKKENNHLLIEGITKKPKEVTEFIKKLFATKSFGEIKLVSLKKHKPKQKKNGSKLFNFKISNLSTKTNHS
ncbi:PilN domain-containing protein [Candidatus Dependentiae bacterium]